MLQRTGDVTRGDKAAHQRQRDARVQRIDRREASPVTGGCDVLTNEFGGGCKPLERGAKVPRVPDSLLFLPVLELLGAAQVKAIEEGTFV